MYRTNHYKGPSKMQSRKLLVIGIIMSYVEWGYEIV